MQKEINHITQRILENQVSTEFFWICRRSFESHWFRRKLIFKDKEKRKERNFWKETFWKLLYRLHPSVRYGIFAWFRIDVEKEPWNELRNVKVLHKKGHGKMMGQYQQQIEDYLDCVSKIYNTRSPIPYGLHQSQLACFDVFLTYSICMTVRDSWDSCHRNWCQRLH